MKKFFIFMVTLLFAGLVGTYAQESNPQIGKLSDTAYNNWTVNAPLPDEDEALDMENKWLAETIDSSIISEVKSNRYYGVDSLNWPEPDGHVLTLVAEWDETESSKDRAYFYRQLDSSVTITGDLKISAYVKLMTTNEWNYNSNIQIGVLHNGILYRSVTTYACIDTSNVGIWYKIDFTGFIGGNDHHKLDVDSIDHFYVILLSVYSYKEWEVAYFYLTDTGKLLCSTGNLGLSAIKPITNMKPTDFALQQNYPNPFNPTTAIEFAITKPELTTLVVYDILGRNVTTLVNKKLQIGTYRYTFNGNNLPSGTYFYKLSTASGHSQIKKMVLIK